MGDTNCIKVSVKVFSLNVLNENQIGSNLNHRLKNWTILTFLENPDSTVDDLLLKCAKKCKITPLYFPLFAIKDSNSGNWIMPQTRLDFFSNDTNDNDDTDGILLTQSTNASLEFRIRFIFESQCKIDGKQCEVQRYPVSSNDHLKPVMNEVVLEYFFYQQRDDYLSGKLQMKNELSDATGAALGVAVLDMLRLAREIRQPLNQIKNMVSFKKLMPQKCKSSLSTMNICNRFRVQMKFNHYLQHFTPICENWLSSTNSMAYFHSKYLKNMELVIGLNNIEKYKLMPELGTNEGKCEISVGGDCGIMTRISSDPEEKWGDFLEITDMSLQVKNKKKSEILWIVTISKLDGNVLSLSFSSVEEAENLASCIDGYYRLLVDAHHYLCKQVASPHLMELLSLQCNGPILCSFAEDYLKSQDKKLLSVGDCVLRQSRDTYDEYYLNAITVLVPEIEIQNYKLDRNRDGKLGIYGDEDSHIHDDLQALKQCCTEGEYYGQKIPFYVERLLPPVVNHKTSLNICRCADNTNSGGEDNPADPSFYSINYFMQGDYTFKEHLGYGKFTTVVLHANKKNPKQLVVLKQTVDIQERAELGQKHHIDESFQASISLLNCSKNLHIVQQLGTMGRIVVLEHVPLGSITKYLSQAHTEADVISDRNWYLSVFWQLAHACNYLEKEKYAHGNIQGKNVLLWQAQPQPHIKLSDPGVQTCLSDNPIAIVEPILPVPWLGYEFCYIESKPTSSSPTTAGDKWSYATTVCEICAGGVLPNNCSVLNAFKICMDEDMKERYKKAEVFPIPELLLSTSLSDLLTQCWNPYPPSRPAFKEILREFGMLLSRDSVMPMIINNGNDNPAPTTSLVQDVRKFEDKKLTLLRPLGEGHFGVVDLYQYDRYQNGRTELVAVKSLRRSISNTHQTGDLINEIETMRRLNHPNVVKLMGVSEPSLRIVMEYLRHGSLAHYLSASNERKTPYMDLYNTFLKFSKQIAQGMIALQEHRLIHRDLAARNILIARDNYNTSCYIKISDFGLSRFLTEDKDYYKGKSEDIPAQWYAPECLGQNGHRQFNFQSDIWSFGVTAWEIFTYGKRPTYKGFKEITVSNLPDFHRMLKNGMRLPPPKDCPSEVYSLIQKCWEYEPSSRISFQSLRNEFDSLILP